MAEIKPFKGLLYGKDKIGGDYSGVVAPPYDVISDRMRDELYERNEHNIIRLILGKALAEDDEKSNKYTRAREYFDRWQHSGVLVRDEAESLYVYSQEYDHKGKKRCRIGFIGLMKIGDPGKDAAVPHENTLARPKEDRLNLIKQVESNLSPIFTLYDDTDGTIKRTLEDASSASDPVIDFEINGQRHKLWRLLDEVSVKKIVSVLGAKKVFIADGHHRYEVARTYRDLRRQEAGYDGRADHVMTYFADLTEPDNLTVMATHRVIKAMPGAEDGVAVSKLREYFDVTECGGLSQLMERLEEAIAEDHVSGFFDGKNYFFMKPGNKGALRGLITEDRAEAWKQLDVSVLHSAVFDKILSISSAEGNIIYVREPEEGEALVRSGRCEAAFFLNPTRVEQLKAVAELGEMMPQKSTYFYPKLLTGLVVHKFADS